MMTRAIAKQRSAQLHFFQSEIKSRIHQPPAASKHRSSRGVVKIRPNYVSDVIRNRKIALNVIDKPLARMSAVGAEEMYDPDRVKSLERPQGLPFHIGKMGHIVINVRDVARSARFYTQMLGFEISDVYPEEMVPGGMAFLRCNTDHHGIALVGSWTAAAENIDLNHIAFEVASLDDVIRARDHLRRHGQ